MYYYKIAPRIIVRSNVGFFTYESVNQLSVGQLVRIPIGTKATIGVVLNQTKKPSFETKSIVECLNFQPVPNQLLQLAHWLSDYHHTPLATVLQMIIPAKLDVNRREGKTHTQDSIRHRTHFVLNHSQQSAVARIETMSSGTALLYGVTGSGKTAVYIELARRIVTESKSAIILIPEIALTTQIVDEFRNAFSQSHPDIPITLHHSKQTEATRARQWQSVLLKSNNQNKSSRTQIVIGPRSSLFLPVADVGLIIVDECHEPSYKQDQAPRYSALRAAGVLAKLHGGRCVLGSATPSINDFYIAQSTHRPIILLPERARTDAIPAGISIVDMTKRANFKSHRFLSEKLLSAIDTTLEANKQVLLYHNRRGTSSSTLCEQCGWSAKCQRCFVPLTLHADKHQLLCHICGLNERVPTSCPVCHNASIIHKGIGTKLIEAEINKRYPNKKVMRFDGDSLNENSVEVNYSDLYSGKIDVIIGTQTVAKGLDLPHLRLVGILQADSGLALPDFSADERVFQLLSQVVGRVGRSNASTEVIVQSFQPSHPAVKLGLAQDYDGFYEQSLPLRKKGHFPPFTFLLKLNCRYKSEKAAISNARKMCTLLKFHLPPDARLLGPTPAFYERSEDWYRWQIIVRGPQRAELVDLTKLIPSSGGHWQTELDPISLL